MRCPWNFVPYGLVADMETQTYFIVLIGIVTVINTYLIFDVWRRYTNTSKKVLAWMLEQELKNVSLAEHIKQCTNCTVKKIS